MSKTLLGLTVLTSTLALMSTEGAHAQSLYALHYGDTTNPECAAVTFYTPTAPHPFGEGSAPPIGSPARIPFAVASLPQGDLIGRGITANSQNGNLWSLHESTNSGPKSTTASGHLTVRPNPNYGASFSSMTYTVDDGAGPIELQSGTNFAGVAIDSNGRSQIAATTLFVVETGGNIHEYVVSPNSLAPDPTVTPSLTFVQTISLNNISGALQSGEVIAGATFNPVFGSLILTTTTGTLIEIDLIFQVLIIRTPFTGNLNGETVTGVALNTTHLGFTGPTCDGVTPQQIYPLVIGTDARSLFDHATGTSIGQTTQSGDEISGGLAFSNDPQRLLGQTMMPYPIAISTDAPLNRCESFFPITCSSPGNLVIVGPANSSVFLAVDDCPFPASSGGLNPGMVGLGGTAWVDPAILGSLVIQLPTGPTGLATFPLQTLTGVPPMAMPWISSGGLPIGSELTVQAFSAVPTGPGGSLQVILSDALVLKVGQQ